MKSTLRRVLAALMIVVAGILAIPSMVFADEGPIAPVAVVGDPHTVTLTPMAWTIITGLILPFVIALVMKASASSTFKGVMAIVLAAVAAVVERATLADGTAVFTTGLLVDVLLVYAPQLLTYVGLWQHVDLNGKIAPTKGLG
jgi:uncharacterized membrane protein